MLVHHWSIIFRLHTEPQGSRCEASTTSAFFARLPCHSWSLQMNVHLESFLASLDPLSSQPKPLTKPRSVAKVAHSRATLKRTVEPVR